jgi:LasA protease
MENKLLRMKRIMIVLGITAFLISGCFKPGPDAEPWRVSGLEITEPTHVDSASGLIPTLEEFDVVMPNTTPTPNPPITLPTPRNETLTYTIQRGDTLRMIAQSYQVSVDQIIVLNEITNPNLIEVGQVLVIPPPSFDRMASGFKIIPDSELVNSPSNAGFNVEEFVKKWGGYLAAYSEDVDGVSLSGFEIVNRVALEYSVNPRLLLSLLEFQSGWVSESSPEERTLIYPMGYYDAWREGLYQQLAWAANLLNEGYTLWKLNGITIWSLIDGNIIQVDPTINPGTAGVLNLMRYLVTGSDWDRAISEDGIFSTYFSFFGYPFNNAYEPMVPQDLRQPALQLPFEDGQVWSFTGGPHGGWNTGSAWAAIDFAPPGEAMGCYPSEAWVVASAAGEIVYADHGTVIQDLDGDGVWQTGWSIFYGHIATWERVAVGQKLAAGDRIGHPSCEGGFSTGTHLHIARRYNGEWIAADGDLPLVLDGWTAVGYGVEYDGYLVKGDSTVEAWNGRSSLNAIKR